MPEDQTLKAWEDYFLPLHKDLEQEARMATGRGDAFGYVDSDILSHGITPSAMAGTAGSQGEGSPVSFMEHFDGHFGAQSAASTGSTVVMESLVTATTTQYKKILVSMADMKTLIIAATATTDDGN